MSARILIADNQNIKSFHSKKIYFKYIYSNSHELQTLYFKGFRLRRTR